MNISQSEFSVSNAPREH